MNTFLDNFHNLYPLSKTLRFELVPIGKTKENFEKKLLAEDEKKAILFDKVKTYCDEYHKQFIEDSLRNIDKGVLISLLKQYEQMYAIKDKSDKEETDFTTLKGLLRKNIAKCFSANPLYNGLFGEKIIEEYLPQYFYNDEAALKEINVFNKFTTYFTGFNENRKNMYSDEEKHTAIAYRLINENLPTYIKNIDDFKRIKDAMPEIAEVIANNIGLDVNDYFGDISNYADTLTQLDIDTYNLLISGQNIENNKKIQGINELVNLHNQKTQQYLPKLKMLYKQILSDKNIYSFQIDFIQNDYELIDSINKYYDTLKAEILEKSEFESTISNIDNFNTDKIFIDNNTSLTTLSKDIYGDWEYITSLLKAEYNANYTGKQTVGTEKYQKQQQEELKRKKRISIAEIENLISTYDKESGNNGKLSLHFAKEFKRFSNDIFKAYSECINILQGEYAENSKELIKDTVAIEKIKNLLDKIKELQSTIKLLMPKDKSLETDAIFYNQLNYDILNEIIPLYNKTRNYLTQKAFSTEKIKLNFSCSTLLDGWDLNKESTNLSIIFRKDGKYFLGIMDKKHNNLFKEYTASNNNDDCYEKMEYKLLPGPNKMLPKVFFSKARIHEFNPSLELISKYKEGCHKKGDKFDINFCHQLIDFFKRSIAKHEDWSKFDFYFSDTEKYADISGFYKEVEAQGYKLSFKKISKNYIDQLVADGKLYLFQIYNKDFSEYSTGTPNLHTLYWKALFDEDNLKNVIYKLNGKAEVFYRKKSIEANITHHKNKPVVNKNPNNKKTESIFEYDLIKNRRYSVDKFLFHVPITMNFKAKGLTKINDYVNGEIKNSDNLHIIGIDRGERHLLYITVTNLKGKIVEQFSLNTIINNYKDTAHITDYHKLLDNKEKERNKSRQSWATIENIKELKEGYMSQVVHKLTELVFKYNAIIVLEDLNSGFKNSRKRVEKQIYDKFETKLISKLSYLVNKAVTDKFAGGGILNAYQLATTDNKSYKQNGIIFYIPAWNTSKIDPTTGFVNLFNLRKIDNDFVSKFNSIRFNKNSNYFEFNFEYKNFSDKSSGDRTNWTICTYGERIRTFRNTNKNSEWDNISVDLTTEFKNLFTNYNIDFMNSNINLIQEIINKSDSKFYSAVNEKDSFYGFAPLFKLLVQLRNSVSNSEEDYILSPVKNNAGEFFDSRKGNNNNLPENADANGAYNIARKGLMLVDKIKNSDEDLKINYSITNHDWLSYVQSYDK